MPGREELPLHPGDQRTMAHLKKPQTTQSFKKGQEVFGKGVKRGEVFHFKQAIGLQAPEGKKPRCCTQGDLLEK